jgi:hypothetical protein
LTNIQR